MFARACLRVHVCGGGNRHVFSSVLFLRLARRIFLEAFLVIFVSYLLGKNMLPNSAEFLVLVWGVGRRVRVFCVFDPSILAPVYTHLSMIYVFDVSLGCPNVFCCLDTRFSACGASLSFFLREGFSHPRPSSTVEKGVQEAFSTAKG